MRTKKRARTDGLGLVNSIGIDASEKGEVEIWDRWILMIGIDAGTTNTRIVRIKNGKISILKDFAPEKFADEKIFVTGVRAGGLELGAKAKTISVDEITAIGRGGLFLANAKKGIVTSVGTGTAIVYADASEGGRFEHVGGTGVGGGTIEGLARSFGIETSEIEKIAKKGNAKKVNFVIGDFVDEVGVLPKNATLSNFAKASAKSRREDVAAGIFSLVGEVVGCMVAQAARAKGEKKAIVVGGTTKYALFRERAKEAARIFGCELIFPKNGEYSTAVGAALQK
ncbi:MAG: hypothetical protein NT157_02860 [Candidatus Micrarchaeota archaeon]|nr:hypothetical protein [Candidatus Micrarchaeota archaeon]